MIMLKSKKEKLMQEAQEIVMQRGDKMSQECDLKDLEDLLNTVKRIIQGKKVYSISFGENKKPETDKEKIIMVWDEIMMLFDNLH